MLCDDSYMACLLSEAYNLESVIIYENTCTWQKLTRVQLQDYVCDEYNSMRNNFNFEMYRDIYP